MPKFRMKLEALAHVSQVIEIDAADLDAAIDQAEQEYKDTDQGWKIDDMVTVGPDRVHVVENSWKRLTDDRITAEDEELIRQWANCQDASVDAVGDVWIQGPQTGHWLSPERKEQFIAWRHAQR